ncbi:alpha/beta hydrolase [Flavobacterium silvaticum]|uniref:Alpha/beta hydrolase n=1 Tax=Flavobacterium silvaticum TaxID=1852020 RepID=A0A972FMZ2_9FLAO|nr:alpha/beta hydrolase [Flavobacterium silvaticum]NMH29011.1 alpha/beta hydrolase [Flavobacterium silvaticum]
MTTTKTIILVHGMFVNDASWANWKPYLENKGYNVYAPANPGHDGDPAELRKHIHPDLTKTGFEDVVMNIVKLIQTLPEKPIVIGHSMAGLAIVKLVELGHAEAGISIDGAPPKNVFPPFSTVKIVWPAVNLLKGNSPYLGTRDWYNRAFFNTLPASEQQKAYDEVAVPESRKIGKDTLFKSFSRVDFSKPHAPLLFIAGEKDTIFPPSLTKRIAGKYSDKSSKVDFKEFAGRSHFLCGEPGWEEIVEYCLQWIESV